MRIVLAALAAFALVGTAFAQIPNPKQDPPNPFGLPKPDIPHQGNPGSLPACNAKYAEQVKGEIAQLETLQSVGIAQVQQICDGITMVERGIESLEKAGKALGIDTGDLKKRFEDGAQGLVEKFNPPPGFPKISFWFAKNTCQRAEGEMSRHVVTELGRLRGEQRRCGGI